MRYLIEDESVSNEGAPLSAAQVLKAPIYDKNGRLSVVGQARREGEKFPRYLRPEAGFGNSRSMWLARLFQRTDGEGNWFTVAVYRQWGIRVGESGFPAIVEMTA